jgi:Right handed beta helix region
VISEPFQICCRLLLVACFFPVSVSAAEQLYVAPNGNDDWTGRLAAPNQGHSDGPLATLEAARDHIRKLKNTSGLPANGVVVELSAGAYERDRTFELTADDSGTADCPIVYRAAPGANVRLIGGRRLYDWKKVTDPEVLSRLDPAARKQVVQTDLKAQGITDFGQVGGHGIELFFQDQPAQLARWPNEGFTKIRDVTAEAPTESHGRKGSKIGVFYYEGDRPKRWRGERDLWLHGYWFWDWSDAYQQVAEVDIERQLIRLVKPDHNYGYRAGARYYALNALAELDTPGEWQLNRQTGTVYVWPPAPVASGHPTVSVLQNLISLRNTSNVSFEKLTFASVRGTAVKIAGGANARIVGCTIRNTGDNGVEIENGHKNAVIGCDIYNTAAGGIVLAGGDRATLTPGENLAENNHIHHYARWKRTYAPAIAVSGVGNFIRHNLFHDAPHNAIQLSGNEHIVEFNEFHHVCLETDDVGAFYMGRDWTQRGNIVRYNYFHHLGKLGGGVGVMAVYLDDWSSGTTVFGNVCYKAGRAVLIGGGRDNLIENNVFVDCTPSVHVDSRGLGWAKSYFNNTDNTLVDRLRAIDYRHPPWSTRYPQLLTLYADEPAVAKGNVIARNISVGGRWLDLADGLTDRVVKLQDNLVDADPHFVDREKEDFRLKDDSPAFALGFKPIPIQQIGLYPSDDRASWPVAGDADTETQPKK